MNMHEQICMVMYRKRIYCIMAFFNCSCEFVTFMYLMRVPVCSVLALLTNPDDKTARHTEKYKE